MKLPNQVRIKRDVTYEVVYQEQIGDDPDTIGYCDDPTKHLYLKMGLSSFDEFDTSIHELLHAITFQHKIKIPHKELDKLATAIAKVSKLNKWI